MRTPNKPGLRGLVILCSGVFLFGCAGSETADETEAMAEETEAMEPMAAITLADFAGTWSVNAMTETGDSTLITFTMNATEDPAGWTMAFPDGPTVAGTVTLSGDSVIGEYGPYESQLREGIMVTVRSVTRMEGDRIVGTFVATYETDSPDSVLNGRLEGTRAMEETEGM